MVFTVNSLISVGGCGEMQRMVSVYPKISACRDWCWREEMGKGVRAEWDNHKV